MTRRQLQTLLTFIVVGCLCYSLRELWHFNALFTFDTVANAFFAMTRLLPVLLLSVAAFWAIRVRQRLPRELSPPPCSL